MKNILLPITAVLLLTGCGQNDEINVQVDNVVVDQVAVKENIEAYNDEELNISFDYPANWRVEKDDSDNTIHVTSPKRDDINYIVWVNIPAESFDEYETTNKELIEEKFMSVNYNYPTDSNKYPAREYGQHGGLTYLIEIENNYVVVTSDTYLDQKQKEGLDVILNSISFLEISESLQQLLPQGQP